MGLKSERIHESTSLDTTSKETIESDISTLLSELQSDAEALGGDVLWQTIEISTDRDVVDELRMIGGGRTEEIISLDVTALVVTKA